MLNNLKSEIADPGLQVIRHHSSVCRCGIADFIVFNDGSRWKPKGNLYTEKVVGFSWVYHKDRKMERQNGVQNRENRSCGMGDEELYGIDVLGISECRWPGFGRMWTQIGETMLRPISPLGDKEISQVS